MRSKNEIRAVIARIEADDRWQSGAKSPACVEINAPLALIQVDLSGKRAALRWVLGKLDAVSGIE